MRDRAARAIGQIGQASPEVIAVLLELIKDESEDARGNAAWSFGRLCDGRKPKFTSPQINRIVSDLRSALDEPRNKEAVNLFLGDKLYTKLYDVLWESLWKTVQAMESIAGQPL